MQYTYTFWPWRAGAKPKTPTPKPTDRPTDHTNQPCHSQEHKKTQVAMEVGERRLVARRPVHVYFGDEVRASWVSSHHLLLGDI